MTAYLNFTIFFPILLFLRNSVTYHSSVSRHLRVSVKNAYVMLLSISPPQGVCQKGLRHAAQHHATSGCLLKVLTSCCSASHHLRVSVKSAYVMLAAASVSHHRKLFFWLFLCISFWSIVFVCGENTKVVNKLIKSDGF